MAVSTVAHLLVGDLQEVQHHSVGPHVFKQPLLLHTTLLTGITQLTEPKEDLNIRHALLLWTLCQTKHLKRTSYGIHLFDDDVVVRFVAVDLRFIISILYWAENTLLPREMNKASLSKCHSVIILIHPSIFS